MRVSHVVNGTRPVTAELALLFGRALGLSPQYWLNLQAAYDLKLAAVAIGQQLLNVAELAPFFAASKAHGFRCHLQAGARLVVPTDGGASGNAADHGAGSL